MFLRRARVVTVRTLVLIPYVFVVITCVLDAGESRREIELVAPVADAPGHIAASHLPSAPHPITDPPPATAMAGKTA
jgi:hypothetical protein